MGRSSSSVSYPGALVALVVMCVTYLLPWPLLRPRPRWLSLATVARRLLFRPFPPAPGVGPWLAYFLMAGAAVSCLGQFVTEMVVDSYQLHGMAEQGLMPAAFTKRCDVE